MFNKQAELELVRAYNVVTRGKNLGKTGHPNVRVGKAVWDYFNNKTLALTRFTANPIKSKYTEPVLAFKTGKLYLDEMLDPDSYIIEF